MTKQGKRLIYRQYGTSVFSLSFASVFTHEQNGVDVLSLCQRRCCIVERFSYNNRSCSLYRRNLSVYSSP